MYSLGFLYNVIISIKDLEISRQLESVMFRHINIYTV